MTLPSEVTWHRWSSASSATHQPHLGHEAVCVGVLLILEHDVRVVVADELVEALGVACDLALCSPAGAQVVLWEVGEELLVVHGRELPGPGPDAVAGARSASLGGPRTGPRDEQAELCQAGPPGLLHWGVSGSTVPTVIARVQVCDSMWVRVKPGSIPNRAVLQLTLMHTCEHFSLTCSLLIRTAKLSGTKSALTGGLHGVGPNLQPCEWSDWLEWKV